MVLEIFSVLVTIAGVTMSFAHFFQIMKIIRRKSAKDISLAAYSVWAAGSFIWLAYGFLINELPIIISFIVSVIGTSMVILLTLKYR